MDTYPRRLQRSMRRRYGKMYQPGVTTIQSAVPGGMVVKNYRKEEEVSRAVREEVVGKIRAILEG